MKNQALFSLKYKSKKLKCRLLQYLLGALRVKSKFIPSLLPPAEFYLLKKIQSTPQRVYPVIISLAFFGMC